jgi:aspartate kinase
MGIKVAKFGGSSVADGIQLAKLKDIIAGDDDIRYVVVSAPGKRFSQDSKLTDLLYATKVHIENNLPYDQLFQAVKDRFNAINLHLDTKLDLEEDYNKIISKLESGASKDYIASRGEYLNAKLVAAYLGYDFVDIKDLIKFDERGELLSEETDAVLKEELIKHERAVIPGFYGSTPDGKVKTFSRGGSDITGSLVARAVNADMYENWTDVSGFLVADPKIVDDPKPIGHITYLELRELSYMGATVLHEDAIYPVREAGIPINIRNTNKPEDPGTIISAEVAEDHKGRIVTGIAGTKDFTVIAVHKNRLKSDRGFLRKLAGVLENFDIVLEHMPSSVDCVSLIISRDEIGGRIDNLTEELQRQLNADSVEVLENVALITTVGEGMAYRTGVSARLFTSLAEAGVNIRIIDQGSNEYNIIIGVTNDDFEKAIRTIYEAFVE